MKRTRCTAVLAGTALLALTAPGVAQVRAAGDELPLSGAAGSRAEQPAATFTPAGNLRVLWASPLRGVLGRGADPQGRPTTAPVDLAANDLPENLPFDGQVTVREAPTVVAFRSGDFLAFWTEQVLHVKVDIFYEHRDLLASHVYGQRFNPAGRPVGRAFAVSGLDVGFEKAPRATLLANGRVLVAWQVSQGSAPGVYARVLRPRGSALGPAIQVDAEAGSVGKSPAIAAADDGGFLVTWQGCCGTNGDPVVLARRFAADGSALGDELTVSAAPSAGQYLPTVARGASGEFLVAWMGAANDETGSKYRIYGRLVSAEGTPIGSDVALSTGSDRADSAPAVAAGPDGYVVAWTVWDATFPYAIYASSYDDALAPRGPALLVNSGPINFQWSLALASDGQGRYVLAWEGFDSSDHVAVTGRILTTAASREGDLSAAPMAEGQ